MFKENKELLDRMRVVREYRNVRDSRLTMRDDMSSIELFDRDRYDSIGKFHTDIAPRQPVQP